MLNTGQGSIGATDPTRPPKIRSIHSVIRTQSVNIRRREDKTKHTPFVDNKIRNRFFDFCHCEEARRSNLCLVILIEYGLLRSSQ